MVIEENKMIIICLILLFIKFKCIVYFFDDLEDDFDDIVRKFWKVNVWSKNFKELVICVKK